MNKAGIIMSLVFAFFGVYICILASQAETSQQVREIASFSCVFWLPSILLYVLSVKPQGNKETK